MDKLTADQRRKNMQAVKNKGTLLEVVFGKALWAAGIRYRKNDKTVFGKPDFTVKKYKVAVFADSEFWHGKDWNSKKNEIKSNKDFWFPKIEKNILRDLKVNSELEHSGWKVLRFWGRDIIKNTATCVVKVIKVIEDEKTKIKK